MSRFKRNCYQRIKSLCRRLVQTGKRPGRVSAGPEPCCPCVTFLERNNDIGAETTSPVIFLNGNCTFRIVEPDALARAV